MSQSLLCRLGRHDWKKRWGMDRWECRRCGAIRTGAGPHRILALSTRFLLILLSGLVLYLLLLYLFLPLLLPLLSWTGRVLVLLTGVMTCILVVLIAYFLVKRLFSPVWGLLGFAVSRDREKETLGSQLRAVLGSRRGRAPAEESPPQGVASLAAGIRSVLPAHGYCPQCGARLQAGESRFCPECGGSLEGATASPPPDQFCPSCGVRLSSGSTRYCTRCGAAIR
jgi:hypothetical protein